MEHRSSAKEAVAMDEFNQPSFIFLGWLTGDGTVVKPEGIPDRQKFMDVRSSRTLHESRLKNERFFVCGWVKLGAPHERPRHNYWKCDGRSSTVLVLQKDCRHD